MALNLKTLGTRTVSALIFGVLLLGSVLWNYYTFSIFFMLVALVALKEFYELCVHMGFRPYKISGYIGGLLTYLLLLRFDYLLTATKAPVMVLVLLPVFIFTVALYNKREQQIQNAALTLSGILYAVLPFGLLHSVVIEHSQAGGLSYRPEVFLGIIFLIWSNDTFAYIGGSLIGRHKMIPRISPGKTWEGTFTGIVLSFGLSFIIRDHLVQTSGWLWPILGVAIPVLATVGDLVESMLKRQAGVKDSGNIMPGHGGALDRFESLLFVSPSVFAIIQFL